MNAIERPTTRWFHVAQVLCLTIGLLLVGLFVHALPHLQSELSKPQFTLVGFLFITVALQWAILSVLIMMYLDPKRRAA